MKKFCFLIAVLMLICMLPTGVFAAENEYLVFNTDSVVAEGSEEKYINGAISGYPVNAADGSMKLRFALLKNTNVLGDVTVKPLIDESYPFVASNVIGLIKGLNTADTYFDFLFNLKDNVYNGVYPVQFTASYNYTLSGTTVSCEQIFIIYVRVTGREEPATVSDAVNFDSAAEIGGSSYANGYMPVLNKANKYIATVYVPLKDLSASSSDITVSFVSDGTFKPTNTVRTLSNKNDKGKVSFEIERSASTYNGIYPAVFHVDYMVNGEAKSKDFTIYVQVADKAVPSGGGGASGPVSQPRVMVTKYSISGEGAVAGEEFDLVLDITNQSEKTKVKNIKVTLSSGGEFVPADGTNSSYISGIDAGETVQVGFKFKTMPDAEPRPATMNVDIAYETPSVVTYSESASLSIPVTQPIRLQIDEPLADTVEQGDTIGVTMKIYNLGKSPLYNVSASVRGEGLMAEENYFGGILEAGGTKTVAIDIIVDPYIYMGDASMDGGAVDDGFAAEIMPRKAKSVDIAADSYFGGGMNSVPINGTLVLTYEDADGNVYTEERDFVGGVNVYQEVFYPEADIPGDDFNYEEPGSNNNLIWIIGGSVIGVGLIAVLVILIIKRGKKKKKEIEDALF